MVEEVKFVEDKKGKDLKLEKYSIEDMMFSNDMIALITGLAFITYFTLYNYFIGSYDYASAIFMTLVGILFFYIKWRLKGRL